VDTGYTDEFLSECFDVFEKDYLPPLPPVVDAQRPPRPLSAGTMKLPRPFTAKVFCFVFSCVLF
jgi:hypothetical protein